MAGNIDIEEDLYQETIDNELETENSEVQSLENDTTADGNSSEPQDKLIKLPLSRIKNIIKTDPDVKLASQDAVVTLAKAAELFIQCLAREAAARTLRDKKKTVMKKHLDTVFDTKDCFAFLEGVIESFDY